MLNELATAVSPIHHPQSWKCMAWPLERPLNSIQTPGSSLLLPATSTAPVRVNFLDPVDDVYYKFPSQHHPTSVVNSRSTVAVGPTLLDPSHPPTGRLRSRRHRASSRPRASGRAPWQRASASRSTTVELDGGNRRRPRPQKWLHSLK